MASGFEDRVSDWGPDVIVIDHRARAAAAVPAATHAGRAEQIAAAIAASVHFIDGLAAALDQRRLDQEETRAEIEKLTQQLAPARVAVAAGMAAQLIGGN